MAQLFSARNSQALRSDRYALGRFAASDIEAGCPHSPETTESQPSVLKNVSSQRTMALMRRSLAVLGLAAILLALGFLGLFASGGSGDVSDTGSLPVLTTTTTTPTPTTVTTIVDLRAIDGSKGKATLVYISAPNVVGMTLAQADATLDPSTWEWVKRARRVSPPTGKARPGRFSL